MPVRTRTIHSLSDVDAAAWNGLVPGDDPFLEHAFLLGLEETGCVGPPDTGWNPRHLLAEVDGRLVGAMPLYKKTDSYGEYIFDWSWAHTAQRAGVPYYPKLVSAVPFTPVTGRRLLIGEGGDEEAIVDALVAALRSLADEEQVWSVHVLFCTEGERAALERRGMLARTTHQFHWRRDPAWETFHDYLGAMRSKARKQIRRERRLAGSHGLDLSMARGDELGDEDWEAMWGFYRSTVGRKHAIPYLNRGFFDRLRKEMGPRVVMALAREDGEIVAGSLFFARGERLLGRYWGASKRFDHVHFELCYYLPIAYCLEHGLRVFEAGAQGPHKLSRGFLPTPTYSASLFRLPDLQRAVGAYLDEERVEAEREMEWLARHSPFRREQPSGEGGPGHHGPNPDKASELDAVEEEAEMDGEIPS